MSRLRYITLSFAIALTLSPAHTEEAPFEGDGSTDCAAARQCSLEIRQHWMGMPGLYRVGYVIENRNKPDLPPLCAEPGWLHEDQLGRLIGRLDNGGKSG